MLWFIRLVLLVQSLASAYMILRSPTTKLKAVLSSGDAGEPLYLTPYVKSGNITEGRRRARVSLTDPLHITSYAGFFTVNSDYNSNHFLWYFPAIEADSATAPVVLWLQGGPGVSSLFGLFVENGPIEVNNNEIQNRKYNWATKHHMIYIDNPIGAGFSFTDDERGYCTNEDQIGKQLYSTLTQFFTLFPELRNNQFYVTGESYAGKYIPALAHTIHHMNSHAHQKINLKGVAIGDGWTDPEHQLVYSEFLYQVGLVDRNQAKVIAKFASEVKQKIESKQFLSAFTKWGDILNNYYIHSGHLSEYNYLYTGSGIDFGYIHLFESLEVRRSIHVGNLPYFALNMTTHEYLRKDMMQSVAPLVSELLDHYNVLLYNGQLDVIVAYPLTVNYLEHLNFTGAAEFQVAKRGVWQVEGNVAGYVRHAHRLTEVMVRNAGHMVPADQPLWGLDLITRFTHNQTFFD